MNQEQLDLYNEIISKYNFYKEQKEQIRLGLEQNLDVSLYANPEFTHDQMEDEYSGFKMSLIKLCLESKLDIFPYLEFSADKLNVITHGLKQGLDVSIYASSEFDNWQMEEIRKGLESSLDVTIYANSEFSGFQMSQIRIGLEQGINIYTYLNPNINWEEMNRIRMKLVDESNTRKNIQ